MTNERGSCWCGGREFAESVHRDYVVCNRSGTIVLRLMAEQGRDAVVRALAGFYDEAYWNEHMDELGFPRILERARLDLAERCQHWLNATLRYVRPPANVLEIGCAHGGFVKLLELAGFAAAGMEMSASVCELARRTFGVRVVEGPIETSPLGDERFDAIALFDVLEHFVDPEVSLRAIVARLNPGGIVIVQTPETRPGITPEWDHFKHPEHVYLLTREGLGELFRRVGLTHLAFEPAIFPHDVFAFASARPLVRASDQELADFLQTTHEGRLVLAMQDLYGQASARAAELTALHAHAQHLERCAVGEHEAGDVARAEAAELRRVNEDLRRRADELERAREQIEAMSAELRLLRASRWVKAGERLRFLGPSGTSR